MTFRKKSRMNLFASPDPNDRQAACLRHLAFLALSCLGVWGWTCGLWDLWGPDESRYVQIAKELLTRHNWFLLTLHGAPYDQKPPLPFWLFAGMLKLNGGAVNSGLVRLPSIIFAVMSVLCTYLIGRRLWGDRAGLIAAFVLLTSAQFMEDAPTAELNIMYTGWTTLALCLWFMRPGAGKFSWPRAAFFWGAAAGAFFTKGPLAILIILSAMAGEAALARSLHPLSITRPIAGFILLIALIAGWLYLQMRAAGSQFVTTQVKGETLERFLHGSHEAPFWYYFPRLFTSIFIPWGVFLIPAGVRLRRLRQQLPHGMAALIGWIIIPFLVLTLANGKRQSYPLPLLPAMSLIVGWFFDQLMREHQIFPRIGRAFAILDAVVGLGLWAAALTFFINPSMLTRHGFLIQPLGLVMLGLAGLCALGLGLWVFRNLNSSAMIWINLTGLSILFGLLSFSAVNPALNPVKTTRPLAERLNNLSLALTPRVIGAVGRGAKPEYHVYGAYQVRAYTAKEIRNTTQTLPQILVGRDTDWKDIPRQRLSDYQQAWRGDVSRDLMTIYIHRSASLSVTKSGKNNVNN